MDLQPHSEPDATPDPDHDTHPYGYEARVLILDEHRRYVLLLQRRYVNGFVWRFVGGCCDMVDVHSPRRTARRETSEEVGLDFEESDLQFIGAEWVRPRGGTPHYLYLFVAITRRFPDPEALKALRPTEDGETPDVIPFTTCAIFGMTPMPQAQLRILYRWIKSVERHDDNA